MSKKKYVITDLEGYAKEMRISAAKYFSEDYNENLDEFITIQQIINLVMEKCIGTDDEGRPMLTEKTNDKIFDCIATWLHNVGLAKLAAKGLVECAWDNDSNEMVFWANKDVTKPQKKKRKSNNGSTTRNNKKKDQGS
jgi:hypothetical protein